MTIPLSSQRPQRKSAMSATSTDAIPYRIRLTHALLQLWPFLRGRGRISQLFLYKLNRWPEQARASFHFRFGRFVDAPIASWPRGYKDLFLYGVFDVGELAMWRRVLKAGATVVDGGANWGYWSLVASKFVGKSGRVHAFEPVLATFEALRKNIEASRASNVMLHQAALADENGSTWIKLAADDPIGGQSSLGRPEDRQSIRMVECNMVTLDEVFQDQPVHLIKLDVEGGELAALRGATGILRRREKPVITFEWNRVTASALGYQPTAIGKLLGDYQYRLFRATQHGPVPFQERSDLAQWSPMIWALTEAQQSKYLNRSGSMEGTSESEQW